MGVTAGPPTDGILSGERRMSLAAFSDRVAWAAAGFAAEGLRSGDGVAILMRNDIPFLEATEGAQRLGAYAVPINWHSKTEEVRYILGDCGARILVGHADLLRDIRDGIPDDTLVLSIETPPEVAEAYRIAPEAMRADPRDTEWERWLAAHPSDGARAGGAPRDSIIYTSGTTGKPKGVRRATPAPEASARIEAMRRLVYGFRPGMRTVMTAPMYHSAPNSYALRAVRQASLVVLMPRFDAETLLRTIERERITHLFMVPTMFVRLLKLPAETRARYDLSSLEFIIHAGAPCAPDVKAGMIAWLGPIIHEFYGGTESGSVTYCDSHDALAHPGTVGRPVEGAVVQIHREDGSLAAPGETGEIFMRISYYPDFAYIGRDDLRREIERDGLITCGDVGYLDPDGFLFICDRKRDMVIVGGVNVYPAEIEAILTGMDGVRDCAVFGIPDDVYGEALMAAVEPLEGRTVEPDAVQAYLRDHLADFKVPRTVEIVPSLPREDTGKIFKRRLRDPYWEGRGRAI